MPIEIRRDSKGLVHDSVRTARELEFVVLTGTDRHGEVNSVGLQLHAGGASWIVSIDADVADHFADMLRASAADVRMARDTAAQRAALEESPTT